MFAVAAAADPPKSPWQRLSGVRVTRGPCAGGTEHRILAHVVDWPRACRQEREGGKSIRLSVVSTAILAFVFRVNRLAQDIEPREAARAPDRSGFHCARGSVDRRIGAGVDGGWKIVKKDQES